MTIPITLANWQQPENMPWSYRNIRQLIPTTRIARSSEPLPLIPGKAGPRNSGGLPVAVPGSEISGGLPVATTGSETSGGLAVAALVDDPTTDGVIAIHRGTVVFEQYRRGMAVDDVHLLQSISKSITGTLAGILVGQDRLDPQAPVTQYIPELEGTSFDGARVRELLDMRTGTRFDETYEDPDSDVSASELQFGWAPGERPAANAIAYLSGLRNHRQHGGRFEYRSILTDVLGLVLERAAGARFGDLVGHELWGPLGADDDASVTVDPEGFALADGGISVTLRDLARFGCLWLNDGVGPRGRVVPAAWIADTLAGGADSREAFAADEENRDWLPGGHYRNKWWVPAGGQELIAVGIHGQYLYINRAAETVCARLSTWPVSFDDALDQQTLAAFRATASELGATSRSANPR